MDDKEHKQIDLIIQGRVKNKSRVEQRTYRYAHLLWEFWKKDTDLFPRDIYTRGHSRWYDDVTTSHSEIAFNTKLH